MRTIPVLKRLPWNRSVPSAGSPAPVVAGPNAVEVSAGSLRVDDQSRQTFSVIGYPREVRLGWLEPVVTSPVIGDLALHVEPLPADVAAGRLRKQLARLESTRQLSSAKGRLADPYVDVAAQDARDLADRLARGEGRLFTLGLYATPRAGGDAALATAVGQLTSLLSSLLLDAVPATFRHMHGWLTTLPLGLDLLRMRRTMDTAAVAAAFPFASADLPTTAGVFYGINTRSRGLVCWDRFAADNHNLVILARSGAGKSYLAKLDALRWSYAGVEVLVVDPEDEYGRLAESVGGAVLRLGTPGVHLNPFELPNDGDPDALTRRALFIHTAVGVLLREEPTSHERAVLDQAVLQTYATAGITADPATHTRPAPVLADLVRELEAASDPAARELGVRLRPFVSGAHRLLFESATTHLTHHHFVVYSLRDLPDELKPVGTLLALDAIWRRVADPAQARRRRIVVVDEAWLLMQDPAGARFLFRMAKSARKYWAGLTVVTQDAADLLGTDLGRAVIANAATQVVLRQAPQAMDQIRASFKLSEGECEFLLTADRGEGLLAGGGARVAFRSLASPAEHRLVTTDPAELSEEEVS